MSELIQSQTIRRDMRWSLLATVSSLALAGACVSAQAASDADRPTVWIELGAQFDRLQGSEEPFLPGFLDSGAPRPFETVPSASIQRPSRYMLGGDGKLSFQPHGSDWSLVAAVRYGRSNTAKHEHQQTSVVNYSGVNLLGTQKAYVPLTNFTDTTSSHKASYLITDFTVGRDVGLGLWSGHNTTSVDFGVRFAQFTAKTTTSIHELPDDFSLRVPLPPSPFNPAWHKYKSYSHHHSFYAQNEVTRSFSGVGPTLTVNGSQPLSGDEDGGVTLDWGANAAVLFGRQKVRGSHITTGAYWANFQTAPQSTYNSGRKPYARSRSVVVPNVGGFAGLSARYHDARLSFGYRADFFFGAMDSGLETRDTASRSFHGPFAKIGIGF